jgi:hypothetical protein
VPSSLRRILPVTESPTCSDDPKVIRTKIRGPYSALVSGEREKDLAGLSVPNPCGLVPRGGNDPAAIGVEFSTIDIAGMPREIAEATELRHPPERHVTIGAGSKEPFATARRQMDPARRAAGKKPDAAAPGNARIVPRPFTSALGGGLSAWAHAIRGDSAARLRRLLLGTRKIHCAVAPGKSRDPQADSRVPHRVAT